MKTVKYDDNLLYDPLTAEYELEMPRSDFQFLRQGGNWYRNPEFGIEIKSERKRNSNSNSNPSQTQYSIPYNPTMVCNMYEQYNHEYREWYNGGQCGVGRNRSISISDTHTPSMDSKNMFLDFYEGSA